MKKILLLLPFLLMLCFLLIFPETSFACAASGLVLWFHTLLPSLLPFMILSNLFLQTDLLSRFISYPKKFWKTVFHLSSDGAYALLLGLLCGYPMGAKVTADLYKNNRISKSEAEYLLTFSSYPGPSFVASYVCLNILGQKELILPSYAILYLSGYLSSLLFRKKADKNVLTHENEQKKEISGSLSLGEILDTSIMNGFEAITKLGGYIILFSVLQGIIKKLFVFSPMLSNVLCGITEMTNGITTLSSAGLPPQFLYPALLGCTAFGGLCIAAQTKSMLTGTDLSVLPYLKGKLCSFAITFLLAYLFIKITVFQGI